MTAELFCKDCAHCRPVSSWFGLVVRFEFARCARAPKPNIDKFEYLVSGDSDAIDKREFHYCSTERQFDCGVEAKFFVPKVAA
jgi:hypothetical protein